MENLDVFLSSMYFAKSCAIASGSSERPLPELIKSRLFLYRLSSWAAASCMLFPGKPGSSSVNTTLFLHPILLIAIWLIAAFKEYNDLPEPPQTTQSADFRSSYSGNSFLLFTSRMFSLILLTYPMRLIPLLISPSPHLRDASSAHLSIFPYFDIGFPATQREQESICRRPACPPPQTLQQLSTKHTTLSSPSWDEGEE